MPVPNTLSAVWHSYMKFFMGSTHILNPATQPTNMDVVKEDMERDGVTEEVLGCGEMEAHDPLRDP